MKRFLRSAALLLICAGSLTCRKVEAVAEDPDAQNARDVFRRYLTIDTSNPPGRETAAARYLQSQLAQSGIDAQLIGSDPERLSVYARLSSGKSAPALLLLHHLDVVPAERSEWTVDPFGGITSGGYIWGRGALDIKSLGVAELMAFLELKKSGRPLSRDVIFLGAAAEETGGMQGSAALLESRPELFDNVGFVLNEGGGNETIVDRISFWGIEVTQKVPLWIRLHVKGRAGHGATPPDDGGAPVRLVNLLQSILKMERPYRLTPVVATEFEVLARVKRGIKQQILADPTRYFASPIFEREFPASYRALLRDTIAVTELRGGNGINSIPGTAGATLDMRLLPGSSPEQLLSRIEVLAGSEATVEVLLKGEPTPESPHDTLLFKVISTAMIRAEPGSVAGPVVSAGTTDSRFFRMKGIVAYGLSPFKVNYYDADGVHGVDEKIRSRFFDEGVRLTKTIVREFCTERSP